MASRPPEERAQGLPPTRRSQRRRCRRRLPGRRAHSRRQARTPTGLATLAAVSGPGEAVALIAAGVVAGAVGAAGGVTSLVSYSALLGAGVPPLQANVCNLVVCVACWPGSASTSRRELAGTTLSLTGILALARVCCGRRFRDFARDTLRRLRPSRAVPGRPRVPRDARSAVAHSAHSTGVRPTAASDLAAHRPGVDLLRLLRRGLRHHASGCAPRAGRQPGARGKRDQEHAARCGDPCFGGGLRRGRAGRLDGRRAPGGRLVRRQRGRPRHRASRVAACAAVDVAGLGLGLAVALWWRQG